MKSEKIAKEETYQQYYETMNKIDKEFNNARAKAKATLNEQLKAIRVSLHEELKAVRAIQQKIRGRK